MTGIIVIIIVLFILYTIGNTTAGAAKAVGRGVTHDFRKAGAEIANSSILHEYLDYLVRDCGWTKSDNLIPIYTSPSGKKGCYADWERWVMIGRKGTDHLTYTDLEAYFRMYNTPKK